MPRATVKAGTAVFVDAASVTNLQKALAQFPPSFFIQASATFLTELGTLQGIMQTKTALPPGPITKGTGVHKQSGRLSRGWGVAVSGTALKDLKGAAFSRAGIKAPRLELGEKVRPGGASDVNSDIRAWIFIPTDSNRRPDGRAIASPKQILDAGGEFVNRNKRMYRIYERGTHRVIGSTIQRAVIDGRESGAWNVLISPFTSVPAFIMVKEALYVPPYFAFFRTGQEFSQTLPPKLAAQAISFWKDVTI
jgi:hypothetical protein